jgi:uncharacterized protein (TIGR03083 family)
MAPPRDGQLWALAHAERAALADDLADLGAGQWRHSTLCGDWDVEQVVAHLTAAASLNQRQWLRSMLGARFRPDVHNQRRLAEHRGRTPAETLDRFRAVVTSTTAPSPSSSCGQATGRSPRAPVPWSPDRPSRS